MKPEPFIELKPFLPLFDIIRVFIDNFNIKSKFFPGISLFKQIKYPGSVASGSLIRSAGKIKTE